MSEFGRLTRTRTAPYACTMCDGRIGKYEQAWVHASTHRILCQACCRALLRVFEARGAGYHVTELEP